MNTINLYTELFNKLPLKMQLMIVNGVEMEYAFNYKTCTVNVKTKNKVGFAEDGKGGYFIAERISHP